MRTFYIFKINPEFCILLRDSPYNLFKTMEQIKSIPKKDLALALELFENVAIPLDQERYNQALYLGNKNDEHYSRIENRHMIYNYYNDEDTNLEVHRSHMLLRSTEALPSFFRHLSFDRDLFVCDFQNQDYFWISQMRNSWQNRKNPVK